MKRRTISHFFEQKNLIKRRRMALLDKHTSLSRRVEANSQVQITEFTPMQIKQAVVGYGGANKEQVTFMVQKLLNIRTKPKPDDVADALAVAICGLHTAATRRWQELK